MGGLAEKRENRHFLFRFAMSSMRLFGAFGVFDEYNLRRERTRKKSLRSRTSVYRDEVRVHVYR